MSVYSTYKLIDSIYNFSHGVTKISNSASKQEHIDNTFRLVSDIMSFNTIGMYYYMPEIVDAMIYRLTCIKDKLEDGSIANEFTSEQIEDYLLMVQDSFERLTDLSLEEKSFFFAYKDKEYFSVMVDAEGNLVEEYKYGQKSEDKTVYQSVKAWMNQYAISIDVVEYCAPIDSFDMVVYELDMSIPMPAPLISMSMPMPVPMPLV